MLDQALLLDIAGLFYAHNWVVCWVYLYQLRATIDIPQKSKMDAGKDALIRNSSKFI